MGCLPFADELQAGFGEEAAGDVAVVELGEVPEFAVRHFRFDEHEPVFDCLAVFGFSGVAAGWAVPLFPSPLHAGPVAALADDAGRDVFRIDAVTIREREWIVVFMVGQHVVCQVVDGVCVENLFIHRQ